MGRKIFIDEHDEETITEICWVDKRGHKERIINLGGGSLSIRNSNSVSTHFLKEDLPKLKAAIDKAIELKWHLEGE